MPLGACSKCHALSKNDFLNPWSKSFHLIYHITTFIVQQSSSKVTPLMGVSEVPRPPKIYDSLAYGYKSVHTKNQLLSWKLLIKPGYIRCFYAPRGVFKVTRPSKHDFHTPWTRALIWYTSCLHWIFLKDNAPYGSFWSAPPTKIVMVQ